MGLMTQALASTTRLSAFVMFVLIGARVFSLTFYGVNGHVWVEELLTSVPGGEIGFLIVINVILFILGCFLDFFEIAFIIVPLLIAPAEAFGIDLIWLGVIIGDEPADLVPDAALRLCAVLPALGRGQDALCGQGDRQEDGAGDQTSRSTRGADRSS